MCMHVRLHASHGTVFGFLESDLQKRQKNKKKHIFHNKHIYIIQVTDIEVL